MTTLINDGICIKCHCPTTSMIDGKPSPFCQECEQFMNEQIAAGKVGKKFKKGKLMFSNPETEE